jgi:hypothetical protein
MIKRLAAFERDAAVLERVARQYDAASPEGMVLRRAGLALLFAALNDNKEQFEAFLRRADADATADATAYLADLRAKRK